MAGSAWRWNAGQVRPFLSVEAAKRVEQGEFAQRVEAAPLHGDGEGAEAGGLEFGDIGAGRGESPDAHRILDAFC